MDQRARGGVFVSYSHRDGIWLEKLRPHLGSLARERGFDVDFWDDTRIRPGTAWEAELMDALQSARVAILLVSSHFLNSGYIGERELPLILEGAQDAGVNVLPVILSPCRWAQHPVLGKIQAVNDPKQPLLGLSAVRREEVFLRVTVLADAALRDVVAAETAPPAAVPASFAAAAKPEAQPAAAQVPLAALPTPALALPPLELNDDWADVVIQCLADGSLLFQSIRGNERLEGRSPRPQPGLLEPLIDRCTQVHGPDAEACAALYELLVPAELKTRLFSAPGVLLALDAVTARWPWELLDDGERAIGLHCAILRKTIAERFTPRPACPDQPALIIAMVNLQQADFVPLPGVQHEATETAAQFREAGFEVDLVVDDHPVRTLSRLLTRPGRVLHASGHGSFESSLRNGAPPVTGLLVGDDLFFGAAEVQQMRFAPEVVFMNASDLGRHSTVADAQPGGGPRPAPSLPDQFLAIGTRAVVAPAGAIDDVAAVEFARAFYDALLAGRQLGDAVLSARRAAATKSPGTSTWGLYLAYGDPEYRLVR